MADLQTGDARPKSRKRTPWRDALVILEYGDLDNPQTMASFDAATSRAS